MPICKSSRTLFSVVWYGRNRRESASETIKALHAQRCGDFELVIEDCGSTDGTLDLFEAAAAQDPRIRIFRRSATRSGEVLLSAMRRCKGDYVVVCPNEGHFLPNAFETIAREFSKQPTAGAICAAGFLVNGHGRTLDRADIVSLLLTSYRPFLPAAFFRREALLAAGLQRDDWFLDSLALDLCSRVASGWGLVFCSEKLVDCRSSLNRADGLEHDVVDTIDNTLRLVAEVFSRDGIFAGAADTLALESRANQLAILWQEYRDLGQPEIEYRVMPYLAALASELHWHSKADTRTFRSLHRLFCLRSHNLGYLSSPFQTLLAATTRMKGRLPIHIARAVWNLPLWGYWLIRKMIRLTLPAAEYHYASPSWETMHSDLYALAAERYEARGQIDIALCMWDLARPPDSATIDSLACQAMLKSPTATDATLAKRQRRWALRHLGNRSVTALPSRTRGRMRIAYHCAFMNSDTMRNMMRNVIAAHDRNKVEVYGYSPHSVPADIKEVFDVWRLTPTVPSSSAAVSDEQFVELVREDYIDVFVECSGFSPGHRFGAMSLRCAPVQISFLNHTGTSCVPNVDYILSDEICTPSMSDCQRYYSEKLFRLPGCFFCFDYTSFHEPPLTTPPHLRNDYVSFGCFGSGGKLSSEIIKIWAQLLMSIPSSILRIQNHQLSVSGNRQFLRDRFQTLGVSPDRLVIEQGIKRTSLLELYSQVDISLDTWPYCGGNSIAESLWHGIPVITYCGDRFSSRYGASLLTAAGCTDLIAYTPDEYIDLAVGLANDSNRLVHLRRELRNMSVKFGLGDSQLFARRLEDAFSSMLAKERVFSKQSRA